MANKLSQLGYKKLEEVEGCRLIAYKDGAGVWTIGYGQTGKDIVAGLTWAKEQANAALPVAVALREKVINDLGLVLRQCEFDALILFEYNTGAFQAGLVHTLLDKIKARDMVGILLAFTEWRKVRNPVTKQLVDDGGLLKRRMIEAIMYFGNY